MSEILRIENISKSFGSQKVLDNISLSINAGEIFSMLGPSGCGKSTLLRICGGFEEPDEGRIILDGVDITGVPPHKRGIHTVFQSYALFPNMTVWDNIAFPLKIAKAEKKYIRQEVEKYLDMIQMSEHADKKPRELSGGQKQRVAIARALVNRPKVLLLDEPLAALDLKLRQRMLVELDSLHEDVGITFVYVTHDQQEAMSISNHIAVMHQGVVEQEGTPTEVYEAPKNSFVAAFIGDTNFFEGTICNIHGDYCILKIDGFPPLEVFNDKKMKEGEHAHLSIRPEKFSVTLEKPENLPPRTNLFQGKVEDVIYLGAQTRLWIRVGERLVAVVKQHTSFALDRKIRYKDDVWLTWHADNAYMLEDYRPSDESLVLHPDIGK